MLRQQAIQTQGSADSVPPFAGVGEALPAAQAGSLAAGPLFGSPVGSAVVFPFPNNKGAWFVGMIRERTDKPVATEQAPELDAATKTAIGMRQVQPLFDELGVRINKRYGAWDVLTMTLAPNQDATQGIVLSPGGSGRTQQ